MTNPNIHMEEAIRRAFNSSDNSFNVTAELEVGDVEIGAVEIKDATSDNRVTVDSTGALKVTGGASSVSADYKSPSDFTATYTSSTTITVSGLPFTISDSSQIAYITVIPSSGDAATYVNGANGITLTVSSNVISLSGSSSPFASGDVYQVGINAQEKSYDLSTNSDMVSVLNPDYDHYTSAEHLIDETDVSAASYRVALSMDGYKHASLHLKGSGGITFTLWASNDSSASTSSDTGWVDVSTKLMGVASLTDSEDIYFLDSSVIPSRLMIKYVASDSTNAVDAWVKRGY